MADKFLNKAGAAKLYKSLIDEVDKKINAPEVPGTEDQVLAIGPKGMEWRMPGGAPGHDGKTPVRGQDYWTAEDQAGVKADCDSYIDSKLGPIETLLNEINGEVTP